MQIITVCKIIYSFISSYLKSLFKGIGVFLYYYMLLDINEEIINTLNCNEKKLFQPMQNSLISSTFKDI